MSNSIILAKNFDVSNIGLEEVQKNSLGGKVVYINYNGEKKITLQTPMMYAPFGLSSFTPDDNSVKYSIDLSFRNMDTDPKIGQMHRAMVELDEKIITVAVENSTKWFGKKMKREVIEELYRPVVKPAKDPSKYAPTIKTKLQNNNKGVPQAEIYDHTGKSVSLDSIVGGSRLQVIMECASIWFVNKQFGVSWKTVMVKMGKEEKISGIKSFVVDSDVEDEEEEEEEYEEDNGDAGEADAEEED